MKRFLILGLLSLLGVTAMAAVPPPEPIEVKFELRPAFEELTAVETVAAFEVPAFRIEVALSNDLFKKYNAPECPVPLCIFYRPQLYEQIFNSSALPFIYNDTYHKPKLLSKSKVRLRACDKYSYKEG